VAAAATALILPIVIQGTAVAGSASVATDGQALLYELNSARWNPAAFGEAWNGVDLGETLPRPPLALNEQLVESATFKANELSANAYFAHRSAVTGLWPNQLARAFGFPLPEVFVDTTNNIESLHAGSPIPRDVLGSWAASPSHLRHVFGQGWFDTHREVGVGRSDTGNYWVVHTAYRSATDTFVTGVAFEDANSNGFMDLGEGLPRVKITVGNRSTTTDSGGGYAIEIPAGRYRVSAEGSAFQGTAAATIRVRDFNVGVDFVSGSSRPTVRDYQLCMNREPTLLGTGGRDIIYGTPGPDIIHGLGGNDTIYGRGGDDIICGGGGQDRIHGGGGNDALNGQSGTDRLKGGTGNDTCTSGETVASCRRTD
jgi:Ca2+-binding RTX toxin-like protein